MAGLRSEPSCNPACWKVNGCAAEAGVFLALERLLVTAERLGQRWDGLLERSKDWEQQRVAWPSLPAGEAGQENSTYVTALLLLYG